MKKALYILIFALAVVACKPQPMLKADRVSISVDAAGGTEVINITANYPWTASTSTHRPNGDGGHIRVLPRRVRR